MQKLNRQRSPTYAVLEPYILPEFQVHNDQSFKFVDHVTMDSIQELYPTGDQYVYARIPLKLIGSHLSVKMLSKIAKIHQIIVGSHIPKSGILASFNEHVCGSCEIYASVFTMVDSNAAQDRKHKQHGKQGKSTVNTLPDSSNGRLGDGFKSARHAKTSDIQLHAGQPVLDDKKMGCTALHTFDIQEMPVGVMNNINDFSPSPVDPTSEYNIIYGFCKESAPAKLEEAGCAVFSQLTHVSELTQLKAVQN